MHEQRKALVRRREQREAWHRQQGELKAAERFGEVAGSLLGGVDAVALRRKLGRCGPGGRAGPSRSAKRPLARTEALPGNKRCRVHRGHTGNIP